MDEFAPIAKAARYIWAVAGIATIGVPGVVIALMLVLGGAGGGAVITLVLTVLLSCWWWWLSGRRWRAWGYAEREKDLVIRRGVLVRRVTIVPYGRMQFVEIKQGPLDRLIGTYEIQLHTAAAATDAKIPLLPEQEAHRLRKSLTELGEAHAAGL